MAWVTTARNSDDPEYYGFPIISLPSDCIEKSKDQRKYWQQHRDTMLSAQKLCGRDDRELGRFFREEAAIALKYQRGWQFVIDCLDGNLPEFTERGVTDLWRYGRFNMNAEIAPYADYAYNCLHYESYLIN